MILIINFLKLILNILRFSKLGNGTTLPGLIIEKNFKSYFTYATKNCKNIILITGTNGKTTTQRFISYILKSFGLKVTSNGSGANLLRGIASTLIRDSDILGKVKSDFIVLEVEEATMPILTSLIQPNYIIITNIFRDQLDMYGEITKTREYILQALKNCPKSKVILNKDDENVASLANEISNKIIYFSVISKEKMPMFEKNVSRFKRIKNTDSVYSENIIINKDLSTDFSFFKNSKKTLSLHFNPAGIAGIYNATAALAFLTDFFNKDKFSKIERFTKTFLPVFGRGEEININQKKLKIILVKNPASFTLTLDSLKNVLNLNLLLILNDNIADGRDISWIWDINFDHLNKKNIQSITISGTRAFDMCLRIKYNNFENFKIFVEPNLRKALDYALSRTSKNQTLFILPNYTAMLEIRKIISTMTKISSMWQWENV